MTASIRLGPALATLLLAIVALAAAPSVSAAAAPANDDFAAAEALSPSGASALTAPNFEATKESGEPDHAGDSGGHSVWYSWTPASDGAAGLATSCFPSFDTLLAVYTGASVDALTEVATNEHLAESSCFGEVPEVEFEADAGTTYWIAVDGAGGASGFFTLTLSQGPENDDLAAATEISALPAQIPGTNKRASKESEEPNHAGDAGGHSVWFSWTPVSDGPVDIATCAPFSSIDTVLAVYTGSSPGALTKVAANDDAANPGEFPECRWTDSGVRIDAVAGTEYLIAVDGASGTVGRFNLSLRREPANDDFAAAQALPASLPGTAAAGTDLRLATKESDEPDHAGDSGGHSVWFSWTPAADGPVAISACARLGDEFETLLAVYTGASVDALTPVADNADELGEPCYSGSAGAQFAASAGTTYWIAVDAEGGAEGRFQLQLEGAAANDDFDQAIVLGTDPPASAFGPTKLATKESGEPDHEGEAGGHSVWFSWTPADDGPVVISICPYLESSAEPLLGVYTGSAVDALTPVAGPDRGDVCGSLEGVSREVNVVAGTTYRIAVDGADSGWGSYSVEVRGKPENDDFSSAETIDPSFTMAGGSTLLATKESGEPDHAGQAGGQSVWFSWTPSESGAIDLTACSWKGLDTVLAVYTGAALGALDEVASNDDAAPVPPNEACGEGASEVLIDAVAGTEYLIAVDSEGGAGSFGLAFESAPANDAFADARDLAGVLPLFGPADTTMATKESGEPNHGGEAGGHSVWYSWTPAIDGEFHIATCTRAAHGFDTVLAVYTGATVDALTEVASNDGAAGPECRDGDSEIELSATAGTEYLIAVDGKAGGAGQFQLTIEGIAANDAFGQPQPLGGQRSAYVQTSNRFAGKQSGEPDHGGDPGGRSIWFKWTAPRDGPVSIDTCGSKIDTLLAIYTGAVVDGLTPVAGNDDGVGRCAPRSQVSFDAVANTVYRIAVDGKGGVQGAVELRLQPPPANDDFATAESLTGWVPRYSYGSTALATKESGEPAHGGDSGGHSVWFSWTPSKSGGVAISACADGFEPLLALYTGEALGSLTPVAAAAGSGDCEGEGSSIGLEAVAGTTYRLAVDGGGGEAGYFDLQLQPLAATSTLTVTRGGSGGGSVSSDPAGIDCGALCAASFAPGATVDLTATAAAGSTFAGWSGGGCSGTGVCQVTLAADTAVTATFEPVASEGGGSTPPAATPPVVPPPQPPPVSRPAPKPKPKPRKCKRGLRKKKVRGKVRCVKKKGKKTRRKKSQRHRRVPPVEAAPDRPRNRR